MHKRLNNFKFIKNFSEDFYVKKGLLVYLEDIFNTINFNININYNIAEHKLILKLNIKNSRKLIIKTMFLTNLENNILDLLKLNKNSIIKAIKNESLSGDILLVLKNLKVA